MIDIISISFDKMIKHVTIFTLSKPIPSEADIIIKIWADLFEVLFFNTGILIRWYALHKIYVYEKIGLNYEEQEGGEGLISDDKDHIFFKLDAKLVLVYDDTEYPVSSMEFVPYSGLQKIKTDRSKLLVEAKVIYNQIIGLNISDENAALLKITNIQIMGKIGI